jgi:hypothetical protein
MELQIIDPKEYGIEESKALELTTGLNPILEDRNALIEKFNEIKDFEVSTENTSVFKALRIGFQKNRTQGINEWHKSAKEVSLRMGQLLDAVKRNETKTNENYEAFLEEKEKFFENQEKERLSLLKTERESFLRPFVEVVPNGLEDLDQDVFDSFLETKKKSHLEKLEADRIEALRIEEARLAEIERQRLIEAENAKLKALALEKEKIISKRNELLRPYIRYIRDYDKVLNMADVDFEKELSNLNSEAVETMKFEAEEERKRQQSIIDAQNEKDARLRAEKALQIKKDAEAKQEKERLETEEKAKAEAIKLAKVPIKKQLSTWVESFELPPFATENKTSEDIFEKFEAFKKWSTTQVNNL